MNPFETLDKESLQVGLPNEYIKPLFTLVHRQGKIELQTSHKDKVWIDVTVSRNGAGLDIELSRLVCDAVPVAGGKAEKISVSGSCKMRICSVTREKAEEDWEGSDYHVWLKVASGSVESLYSISHWMQNYSLELRTDIIVAFEFAVKYLLVKEGLIKNTRVATLLESKN